MKKSQAVPPLDHWSRFTRDLDKVSKQLNQSSACKADIRAGFRNNAAHNASTGQKFTLTVPQCDLYELGNLLLKIRRSTEARLHKVGWPGNLPRYEPLTCPVSLFGTLNYGLRETAHTRTLAWLLDPQSPHGFQDTLLKVFLKETFKQTLASTAAGCFRLSTVRVHSELKHDESQDRLDIFLEGRWSHQAKHDESWMVIVEAKVEAIEGEDQCARYESTYRRRLKSSTHNRLVFLTPDGRAAKTTGAGKTSASSAWHPLSFLRLIAIWRPLLAKLQDTSGFDFLRLYITGVLTDIYDLPCGELGKNEDIYLISEYLTGKTREDLDHE